MRITKNVWFFAVLGSIFPLLLLVWKSFTGFLTFGALDVTEWTIRGYQSIFQDVLLIEALWTTMYITFLVIWITLVCAFLAGRVLALKEWKGKSVIELLLFSPLLLPVIAIAIGLQIILIRMGIADTVLGVVMIHLLPTLPYATTMMRSGMERMGQKWREQGMLLHPSNARTLFLIELPLLLPTIRSIVFLTTVISLSQYALTAIIGGGNVITLALIFFPYANSIDDTMVTAFALLFALLPIFFFLLHELLFQILFSKLKKRWLT